MIDAETTNATLSNLISVYLCYRKKTFRNDEALEKDFGMGRMKMLFIVMFLPVGLFAQKEWVLQPWTQIIGQLGEALGLQVTSVTPRSNLPYKATISKLGSFGFYSIESQADTLPKRVYAGGYLLTGDLNDDGHMDIVGLKNHNSSDTVYVYWGTETGIDTVSPLVIAERLTPLSITDINNDGRSDLVLANTGYSRGRGKVSLYYGPTITATANASLIGDNEFNGLGQRCAVGDLNADGLNDLVAMGSGIVGNSGPNGVNYINIYWGAGSNQLHFNLGAQIISSGVTARLLTIFDVNGDGINDLLWECADSSNWIYVHYGRVNNQDFKTTPDLKLTPPTFAGFDFTLINGGDLNGDGYNDVVVGARGFQNIYHYVLVYSGGPKMDGKFDAAVGTDNGSYFGWSIAALGDLNGDGLADILVGAPQWGRYGHNENKGFWGIFLGDRRIPASSTPEPPIVPKEFKLNQNYPNPFNSSTVITYSMPFQSHITIRLFDLLGREVDKIRDGERAPGDYYFRYTPNNLPTGPYIYRLEVQDASGHFLRESRKMLIIR